MAYRNILHWRKNLCLLIIWKIFSTPTIKVMHVVLVSRLKYYIIMLFLKRTVLPLKFFSFIYRFYTYIIWKLKNVTYYYFDLFSLNLIKNYCLQNSSSKLKSSASLKFMLRLFFTNKMFLTYMLSSCLLIQGFASSFAVFPLYAEELGIAKYHVSFCYIILLNYKIKSSNTVIILIFGQKHKLLFA